MYYIDEYLFSQTFTDKDGKDVHSYAAYGRGFCLGRGAVGRLEGRREDERREGSSNTTSGSEGPTWTRDVRLEAEADTEQKVTLRGSWGVQRCNTRSHCHDCTKSTLSHIDLSGFVQNTI